jgi:hypothetical protein
VSVTTPRLGCPRAPRPGAADSAPAVHVAGRFAVTSGWPNVVAGAGSWNLTTSETPVAVGASTHDAVGSEGTGRVPRVDDGDGFGRWRSLRSSASRRACRAQPSRTWTSRPAAASRGTASPPAWRRRAAPVRAGRRASARRPRRSRPAARAGRSVRAVPRAAAQLYRQPRERGREAIRPAMSEVAKVPPMFRPW